MSRREAWGGRRCVMGLVITLVGLGLPGLSAPEIDVQRPVGSSIADGGAGDLGTMTASPVSLTYTIDNTAGTDPLSVDTPSASNFINTSGFLVTNPPPGLIQSGSTGTFTIQFDIDADGPFSFDMDIGNNDSDENPYDIVVSGTLDATPPSVDSIVRADSDPTNATSVDFAVTFDESVTGVDATDFVLDASGVTGTSIGAVTGGGTTWNVPVDTGIGDGTLSIDLNDDDTIEDLAGNRLAGTGVDNGGFGAGEAYTIDKTAPSIPDGLDPVNGAYTNDTTPALSWNASTDTGGSGMRDTDTYRYVINGTPSRSGYTTNTTYTPTLAEGVFVWRVRARDNAGNNSAYTADYTLTIDVTDPTDPTPSSTSHTVLVWSNDTVVDIVITGTADPVSNGAQSGVDGFDYAWDQNETWTATEVKDQEESWTGGTFKATSDGGWYFHIATADNASNWTGTEHLGPFQIDTDPPVVSDVTVSDTLITDADTPGTATFVVTVDFDEAMNTGVDPTLVFNPGVGTTLTLNGGQDGWTDADTYVAKYNVADAGVDVDSVTIDVTSAQDPAGNGQEDYTPKHEFEIDTLDPTVISVTANLTMIAEANTGNQTFTLTIDYDEAMNTGVAPAVTFPVEDLTGTIALHPASGWTNSTMYVARYDVVDADEEIDDIDVRATGTQDLAGNTQTQCDEANVFSIDTLKPTVLSITNSDSLISDADAGGQYTEWIVFSESVRDWDTPAIAHSPCDAAFSATCTFANYLWYQTTYKDDSFRIVRDVADAGVACGPMGINVSDIHDLAGNLVVSGSLADAVTVDTLNPTITSITSAMSDGYYNVGANINVTVSFSENVTCSGDFFQVPLDTGDVIQWEAFALTGTISSTYGVDAGDNSCDLDSGIPLLAGAATLKDAAGNDADLVPSPPTSIADGSDITVDTADSTIGAISITAGNNRLDVNCEKTVSYSVTITDNCCIDLDASPIVVTPSATNATVSGLTMNLTPNTGKVTSVEVSGAFVVSVTDACSSIPSVQVDVIDCTGNSATRTDSGPTISDNTAPRFSNFTVMTTDGLVDANCEKVVSFSVDVHDNCCVDLDDPTAIVVTESATNASTSGLTWSAAKVGLQTDFTITGSFTVENLIGCPAIPTIEVQVTDLCGNTGTASEDGGNIEDEIVPEINDLMFNTDVTYAVQETDYHVDDCCEATIYFSANVTDNCCVSWGNVDATVTLPPANGVLEDIVVNRVQNGQNRVDVTGSAVVRCLTSCPARIEVHVEVSDCCENNAIPQTTTGAEGLVHDEIEPIPRDDPRQDMVMDESAIIDPLVEVRLDEFGVYRLLVREDTPVRIDILANDADNCSCEDRAHPFDPCSGCGECSGCCGTLYVHEIVDEPTYGTATIEDDEGDCGGGSVIRFAPDQGYIGPDQFAYTIRDVCGDVSSVIATVYLQTIPEVSIEDVTVVVCSGEPTEFTVSATDLWVDEDDVEFEFVIISGPSYGVVVGDPLQVTYTPPSTIDIGGQPVPTLDFTESAEITLTYTSSTGFTGREIIMIRFEDPFGNCTTARVDISVMECVVGDLGIPAITMTQSDVLPIIVPEGFESVIETAWGSVLLISLDDGTEYSVALSVEFNEEINRYVVYLDTGPVPIGEYLLMISLGNGETVELTIEVEASEAE